MKHVAVVVKSCAVRSLGGRVIPLFKGVNKHVNEGVDHKSAQKQDGRKQVMHLQVQSIAFLQIETIQKLDKLLRLESMESHLR